MITQARCLKHHRSVITQTRCLIVYISAHRPPIDAKPVALYSYKFQPSPKRVRDFYPINGGGIDAPKMGRAHNKGGEHKTFQRHQRTWTVLAHSTTDVQAVQIDSYCVRADNVILVLQVVVVVNDVALLGNSVDNGFLFSRVYFFSWPMPDAIFFCTGRHKANQTYEETVRQSHAMVEAAVQSGCGKLCWSSLIASSIVGST